ncbi:MAG: DUF1797 family protein, partial [Candidatus Lokiarchaeota archaeon]|nr:DUF1797 family protein [Candidatus Lokiarchaeota archaeon]
WNETVGSGGIIFEPSSHDEMDMSNLSYGTIEYWMYFDPKLRAENYLEIWSDDFNEYPILNVEYLYDSRFNYSEYLYRKGPGSTEEIILEDSYYPEIKTWYHFRMDFCFDNTSYMGLNKNTFQISVNDHSSQKINIPQNANNFSRIVFYGEDYGGSVYIDNIGLSWDPNYNVGDNRYANETIQYNEGDTVLIESNSKDSSLDFQRLIYNWGPLSTKIDDWEDKGWKKSYNFQNDDGNNTDGIDLIGFVGDPYYAWDIETCNYRVNNIQPDLDINSPRINTDISMAIFNNGTEGSNFSIELLSNNFNLSIDPTYPAGFSDQWVNISLYSEQLSVFEDWYIILNQTSREDGEHLVLLKFLFDNNLKIIKTFTFNGSNSLYNLSLNDMWFNSTTNLLKVPLLFESSIKDPSNDKISLDINYKIRGVYEIEYTDPFDKKTYLIEDDPRDIIYELTTFEKSGNYYAQIDFIQDIRNTWETKLKSKKFPVNYQFDFSIDMTGIEIFDLIDNILDNENIIKTTSNPEITHYVNASYHEIEPKSIEQNMELNFNITSDFEFENLAPSIKINLPNNISEDQNYTYLVEVKDYENDNLTVNYSFGEYNKKGEMKIFSGQDLGNETFRCNYTYNNDGKYLIKVIASDGHSKSSLIHLIEVKNQKPYAKILNFENISVKGNKIKFTADIFDTESDKESLRYYWDFDDGTYSDEMETSHSYKNVGEYMVKLIVKDDNGASYIDIYNYTIIDEPPEILGPYSFNGLEGHSLNLDVDVYESVDDILMNYTWDIYKAVKIYNATFNFMNISSGDLPSDPFEFMIENDIDYKVIDSIGNHIKVLKLEDDNNQSRGSWKLNFGDNLSDYGTIEFWLRSSDLEYNKTHFFIQLSENASRLKPIIIEENGSWIKNNKYNNNKSKIYNIIPFESNKWTHFRIDYECTDGNYLGLGKFQWKVIVNDVISPIMDFEFGDPPLNNVSFLDTLHISSGNESELSIYCDSIGFYSNISNYKIGDNKNPVIQGMDHLKKLHGKDPSITLDEGTYLANLTVKNNLSAQKEIFLEISNIKPLVSVSSKNYYGIPSYINITGYAWDSIIDSDNLKFKWFINGEKVFEESGVLDSTIDVFCNNSGIIKGHVSVSDPSELVSISEFYIRVFIDNNGDGLTNELEKMYNFSTLDEDQDNLPNVYENLFGSDPFDNDTDNDGILDGWDDLQVGEYLLGTNVTNNDTDYDLLLDGFEVFGWNVTISKNNTEIIYFYTSNPRIKDTDHDGVSDYWEYIYRTNPRNPDTDYDNLDDYLEIYVWETNPINADMDNDGLTDFQEVSIGTHYNNSDTDNDGILDCLEILTDPLCRDSDHDFLSDSEEYYAFSYKINGRKSIAEPVIIFFDKKIEETKSANMFFLLSYDPLANNASLSDFQLQIYQQESELLLFEKEYFTNGTKRFFSENIDIKEIINDAGISYYGHYVLKVTFVNPLHASLCCEEFDIEALINLDPNNADYDNDGIMDGVETQLIVEGTEIINYEDYYNITADDGNSSSIDVYQIDISDIGKVYNAEINCSIVSNETLRGNGSVYVKVVKRELDYRKSDIILLTSNISFSSNDNFSKDYHINLSNLFPENYFGEYQILVDINSNNFSDSFNLTNIKLKKIGFRSANKSDTTAWITSPYTNDTDRDGWSDYFEIYKPHPTNPLSWDTDGDLVSDSHDINPLYDMMLEIKFIEASINTLDWNYVTKKNKPDLQMVLRFNHGYGGILSREIAFVSPHRKCKYDKKLIIKKFLGIEIGRKYYYTSAKFNDQYYIDINDNKFSYELTFELWDEGPDKIDQFWDDKILSKSCYYNPWLNEKDVPKNVEVSSGGESLKASITLRGISRANTIAIFDNNTVFNGHYNTYDRMHIIQINVTDSTPSNSSFDEGYNVILIPNSVLMKTSLYDTIQNDTKLSNSVLSSGRFLSVDSGDLPETASNNVETLYIISCTYLEAEEILELALMGIINETSNEIGLINKNASKKLNGFRAEMMNLHNDILDIVGKICPYENSPMGSMPRNFGEWVSDKAKAIIEPIVGFFLFLKSSWDQFWNTVASWVGDFFGNYFDWWIKFWIDLAEYIAKKALLLLIISEFTFLLMISEGIYLSLSTFALIFCDLKDVPYEEEDRSIDIFGKHVLSYGYEVDEKYIKFLDANIPIIKLHYTINYSTIIHELHYFTNSLLYPSVVFYDILNESMTEPLGDIEDFFMGVGDMMVFIGSAMSITGATLRFSKHRFLNTLSIIANFITICSLLIAIIESKDTYLTKMYLLGFLCGGLIMQVVNIFILMADSKTLGRFFNVVKGVGTAYGVYSFIVNFEITNSILNFFNIGHIFEQFTIEGIFESPNIYLGCLSLAMGILSMGLVPPDKIKTRSIMAGIFTVSSAIIPLILFVSYLID